MEETNLNLFNPFDDLKLPTPLEQATNLLLAQGDQQISNVDSLSVGAGTNMMGVDQSGLFLGGNSFATAPFSVDPNGNVNATALTAPNVQVQYANVLNVSVATAQIQNAAITTAKIANAAITTALIGNAQITTALIASAAITDAKINDVSANKLTAGTIDANTISVIHLNASNISSGTMSGSFISGGDAVVSHLYASTGVAIGGAGRSVSTLDMQTDIGMNSHNINGLNQVFVSTVSGGAINGSSLSISGSKSAIIPTSKGWRRVYSSESPKAYFFDFAKDEKHIDPLFLEITEGDIRTVKTMQGDIIVFRKRKTTDYFRNIRFARVNKKSIPKLVKKRN